MICCKALQSGKQRSIGAWAGAIALLLVISSTCAAPHAAVAETAVPHAFCLPHDIRQLKPENLVSVGASGNQHQWLDVAGWPCQDLSPAGKATGLQGERSALLHHLVRIIGALQQLKQQQPPGYIIENVPMQFHPDQSIAKRDFEVVCSMIGHPTVLDAARFGSLAHRVRNFWTNLCTPMQLAATTSQVVRPDNRTVDLALGPGRAPVRVVAADKPPRYCCNTPGSPMQAWPTFMAHPASYSFGPGQPGSVLKADGTYDQPTAVEREFALGYPRDSTAALGVTEQQRRKALGECMDSHCMQCMFAITNAWWRLEHSTQKASAESEPTTFTATCACSFNAAAQEKLQNGTTNSTDIWEDTAAMHLLRTGSYLDGTSAAETSRIHKRLRNYSWKDGKVIRTMPDGTTKLVPAPQERLPLIKQLHDRCGHFGIRRTAALVLNAYWWHGLNADVSSVVGACKECDRIKASFGQAEPPALQPLPYQRHGVPLAGGSLWSFP